MGTCSEADSSLVLAELQQPATRARKPGRGMVKGGRRGKGEGVYVRVQCWQATGGHLDGRDPMGWSIPQAQNRYGTPPFPSLPSA